MAAREAAAMPLPSEDTTPPVTKTSGVTEPGDVMGSARRWKPVFYRFAATETGGSRNPAPTPAARGSWPVQKRPGGCRGAADSGTKAGKRALRLFFFLEFFLRLVRLRGGIGGIGVGGGVAGIHG